MSFPRWLASLTSIVAISWVSAGDIDAAPKNYVCQTLDAGSPRQQEEAWPLCTPQIIVAGAEKSGTTSVYEYLKAHPDFLPVEGTYLFNRSIRARIVRTLIRRAVAMREGISKRMGKKPPADHRHDVNRWLRLCNVSKEEIMDAEPGGGRLMTEDMRFPDLESHSLPVRMGKEVRFWHPKVAEMLEGLDVPNREGYYQYLELFGKIPKPPENDKEKLPAHLEANLFKVTGEASPQYLDAPNIASRIIEMMPRVRLIFVFRDPTKRYWSQACMVDGMSPDNAPDPKLKDFGNNVLSCLGDDPLPTTRQAANRRVPGGGAVKRMSAIDWFNPRSIQGQWQQLSADLSKCFSHGTAQFLLKSMYWTFMMKWVQAVPRGQILALPSEELFAEPVATMEKIAEFAGLRPLDVAIWDNATRYRHTPHFDVRHLEFQLDVEKMPRKKKETTDTKPKPILCSPSKPSTAMSPQIRELLENFYSGPSCALQHLLHVNWSRWSWPACSDFGGKASGSSAAHRTEL